jgi:HEAT repeat protein
MCIRRHLPIAVLICILGVAVGFGQTINQEPLPDDANRLVQLLGDGNLQRTFTLHVIPNTVAVRAAKTLIKMADDAVPALEKALSSSNEQLRFNVVYVLARIPTIATSPGYGGIQAARNPDAIVSALIRAASDPHAPVRALAVGSLPAYTSEEVRRILLAALNDVEPQVRNAAIAALAPWNEMRPDSDVRHATARAIIPLLDNVATQYDAARTLGKLRSNVAAIPLLKLLGASDKHLRSEAARALGSIKDKQIVVELCAGLKDADPHVRMCVCRALGDIGDMRATPALLETLTDKDDPRREAAIALGKIGDFRASDKLIQLLEDPDEHVRSAAAEALGIIGDKRAISPIGKLLLRNDRQASAAAGALGRIRDPQAIEPLKQFLLLPDLDWKVAEAAAQALGQIRHPDAIAALVEASKTQGNQQFTSRFVLSQITGYSFDSRPQEVIDAWWQSNREHYYRQMPELK